MTSIEAHVQQPYKYGFVTDIESEVVPAGLNEDVIRLISAKKGEPEWMLAWRLKAYRNWLKMSEPHWPNVKYGPIDYQAISYYAAPKKLPKLDSLDQVDPKLVATFEKLGIPIEEQKRLTGVAVDPRTPRARPEVSRHGRAAQRQLLRGAEYCCLYRRLLRLRAEGCALSARAVDLLPHQRVIDRSVRADAHHRGRGQLCELPRGLLGADARRASAARRGRGARRARARHDQVFDDPELVPGRRRGEG